MPKFTRNPRRIRELRDLSGQITAHTSELIRSLGKGIPPGQIKVWILTRSGEWIHAGFMLVSLDQNPEWRSNRETVRGALHLLTRQGGMPFWVDLLDVRQIHFEKPDDYVPSGHPLG